MLRIRNYTIALFCLAFAIQAKATHNRAGEITYRWLFGYTYEIKVTTYTNIGSSGLADRCQDTVYFGDGTHAVVNRTNGPSIICAAPAHDGVPLSGTVKLNEYITTHTYPGPGNYIISMEDPNRNAGVINIPNSINQVFYIESLLVIPAFGSGHNDSPVLSFPPIDNGCVSKCFYHNPGAYDIDGDSLSYELTYSRGQNGAACPGYNYPATGGGTYKIDSVRGTLTWCAPQIQGSYNLAMIIKEWRLQNNSNYVLIGYVLRDFQVDVGTCNQNTPAIANTPDTCILVNTGFSTNVSASDPDGDILSLAADGGSFHTSTNPSVFVATPAASPATGIYNWAPDYTAVKRLAHQVTIKAKDNGQSINLVHFNTFLIKVIPDGPINLSTTASNDNIVLKWNKPATYSTTGDNKFFRYMIYRKTGLSNWVHTNRETIPPAYTGFAFLGYTNNSVNDTVFYDFNNGNPFPPAQDFSYVVLAQYDDGSTSYVSNIASNQIYVGLKDLSLSGSDISVFPNPVTETAVISFQKPFDGLYTIELFDITGRKIKTLTHNRPPDKQSTFYLNMEGINPGVYIIKIIREGQAISKKIIKQ